MDPEDEVIMVSRAGLHRGVRVVAPAQSETSRIVLGSTVVVDTAKGRADAAPPAAFNQMSRGLMRAAPRLQSVVVTSAGAAAAAKQAGDSIARGGCYDVVAPVDGPLPRRIVLDTTAFGDSGLMRRVARVAPAESARAAYWVEPARDSVEVVILDGPTLVGRVTPRGWNGAARGLPFAARRCGAR